MNSQPLWQRHKTQPINIPAWMWEGFGSPHSQLMAGTISFLQGYGKNEPHAYLRECISSQISAKVLRTNNGRKECRLWDSGRQASTPTSSAQGTDLGKNQSILSGVPASQTIHTGRLCFLALCSLIERFILSLQGYRRKVACVYAYMCMCECKHACVYKYIHACTHK